MSHFAVLVIGKNPEQQLSPFQENNMDDCPKEYLKFEDEEDEYLKKYKTESRKMVVMPSGELVSPFDDRFKVKGKDSFSNDTVVPPELKQKNFRFTKLYKTFEIFMDEYAGFDKRDEKTNRFGYWSNPNSKWDWHQLGGRWTGYFKLQNPVCLGDTFSAQEAKALANQYGVTTAHVTTLAELVKKGDQQKLDDFNRAAVVSGGYHLEKAVRKLVTKQYINAKVGSQGLMTAPPAEGYADQALKRDIDFLAMRQEARDEAAERYDRLVRLFGEVTPLKLTWKQLLARKGKDIQKKRELYHAQPQLKKIHELSMDKSLSKEDHELVTWLDYEDFTIGREQFIKRAGDGAAITFAVIKDGKWYERGEMGWFGCVGNEKDPGRWESEFSKLIDSISGDTLLSVYDCHI